MKKLSQDLAKKYAEIISEVQAKGYKVNEENLRNVAKEMGKEAFLEQIDAKAILKATLKAHNDVALIKFFAGIGIVIALGFACVWYFGPIVNIPRKHNTTFYNAFTSEKGSSIWLIYHYPGEKPTINIVDGQKKKLLKEIETDITQPMVYMMNNAVYLFDNKSHFEARDSYTGEIIFNDEALSKQNPRLTNNIGTLKYNSPWLDIVAKQGELFYYDLQTNKLYNENERNIFLRKYTNQPFNIFTWRMLANDEREKEKEKIFMLTSRNNEFYNKSERKRKETSIIIQSHWNEIIRNQPMYQNEKFVFSLEKTFLNAEILYGDSLYCVIRHQTEIGENAKALFSCISVEEKKVLWQIQDIDPKQSIILANLNPKYIHSLLCNRYKNLLNITNNVCIMQGKITFHDTDPATCQIDLQTGKILWECSPTY